MTDNWKIRDLIDLEYFLGQEYAGTEDGEASRGADFDRNVYLSYTEDMPAGDSISQRRRLLRFWLEQRRAQERACHADGPLLPGNVFSDTMRIVKLLIGAAACIFGAGLAWSLLSYTGREAVNVFTCIWVLVVPQVLLLLFLLGSVALGKMGIIESLKGFYPVFGAVIYALMQKIARFAKKRMNADTANRISGAYALMEKTRRLYAPVFFWPVFLTGQIAGILFNTGILGALLVKIAITDLAFGWQTTLQLAPETVLRLVEIAALPWSWLFDPPVSHPTLAQIAGSQMILKEGIFHLATGDLVAWWPFILLCVSVYGLLPRLLIAGAGAVMKRRALSSLTFTHAACDRLVMRMQSPRLTTSSEPYRPKGAEEKVARTLAGGMDTATHPPDTPPAVVLVPEEIINPSARGGLDKALIDSIGIRPAALIFSKMDPRADSDALRQTLSEKQNENTILRIVIVQEAWQPPIKETMSWINSLRTAAGGTAGMIIALTGKPLQENFFTPPSAPDQNIWEQAVHRLKDPYVRIISLGGDNHK
ncbi:MAG: DUF2868 domain-containing protein [Desulfosalsimonadaceae bacterium]